VARRGASANCRSAGLALDAVFAYRTPRRAKPADLPVESSTRDGLLVNVG
jgi:hypothetical protein